MKNICDIILFPLKCIFKGLLVLSLLLSRGFYFYVSLFFRLLKKIFGFKFCDRVIYHFEKRKEQPEFVLILILWCVSIVTLFDILYINDNHVVNLDSSIKINDDIKIDKIPDGRKGEEEEKSKEEKTIIPEINQFKIYGKLNLNEVNFSDLKKKNADTVAWLSVDRTNVNYPIVKTSNNDFYLDHTFDKTFKKSGWTFMDYRNNLDMRDDNTIFYGHNLLNKTSFGSISNIFTNKWFNESNKMIIVLTENKKYVYKIFSAYYIDPEIYYLTTNFSSFSEKEKFLNTLKKRSVVNFDENVNSYDKIITLSTCTEDNKGRKVVHAKLISTN